MQLQKTATSLVDQWLQMQKDIYIYAPNIINGARWNNESIGILLKSYDESPIRLLMLSFLDPLSRNYRKLTRDSFKELRTEMAGYLQIDVIEETKIKSVHFVPVVSLADIDIQEIGLNWIPQGEVKTDLLFYLLNALLQNNKNRSIIPVWLRWVDSNKYALFNWR